MSDAGDPLVRWFQGLDLAGLLELPEVTGQGVRVALLDTGIDAGQLGCRLGESLRFPLGQSPPEKADAVPANPHGTTVAATLLAIAPRIDLYSADVFGARGTCEVETLLRALRHALDVWKVRIINLSLGISEGQFTQVAKRFALQRFVEEAYFRKVMVVAAAGNDHPHSISYPAAFGPPVFGVGRHEGTVPRDIRYAPRDRIEFVAPGRGTRGPLANVPTTSWATPHVTGVIAQLLGLCPELTPFEVKTLLCRLSAARQEHAPPPEPRTC